MGIFEGLIRHLALDSYMRFCHQKQNLEERTYDEKRHNDNDLKEFHVFYCPRCQSNYPLTLVFGDCVKMLLQCAAPWEDSQQGDYSLVD